MTSELAEQISSNAAMARQLADISARLAQNLSESARSGHEHLSDSVRRFLNIHTKAEGRVSVKLLYAKYAEEALREGGSPVSAIAFNREMKAAGYITRFGRGRAMWQSVSF